MKAMRKRTSRESRRSVILRTHGLNYTVIFAELGGYPVKSILLLSRRFLMVEETRKRPLSKAEDLHPQNRRRHTMANTQLQFLFIFICILVTHRYIT